jgi:hypothetical protein
LLSEITTRSVHGIDGSVEIFVLLEKAFGYLDSIEDLDSPTSTSFVIRYIIQLVKVFGFELNFDVFLVAIPPIFLLTIIPVSLAGWGVRESAMVGILVLVGAAKSGVLAISILYGLILIISSLPGAYFWTVSKKRI